MKLTLVAGALAALSGLAQGVDLTANERRRFRAVASDAPRRVHRRSTVVSAPGASNDLGPAPGVDFQAGYQPEVVLLDVHDQRHHTRDLSVALECLAIDDATQAVSARVSGPTAVLAAVAPGSVLSTVRAVGCAGGADVDLKVLAVDETRVDAASDRTETIVTALPAEMDQVFADFSMHGLVPLGTTEAHMRTTTTPGRLDAPYRDAFRAKTFRDTGDTVVLYLNSNGGVGAARTLRMVYRQDGRDHVAINIRHPTDGVWESTLEIAKHDHRGELLVTLPEDLPPTEYLLASVDNENWIFSVDGTVKYMVCNADDDDECRTTTALEDDPAVADISSLSHLIGSLEVHTDEFELDKPFDLSWNVPSNVGSDVLDAMVQINLMHGSRLITNFPCTRLGDGAQQVTTEGSNMHALPGKPSHVLFSIALVDSNANEVKSDTVSVASESSTEKRVPLFDGAFGLNYDTDAKAVKTPSLDILRVAVNNDDERTGEDADFDNTSFSYDVAVTCENCYVVLNWYVALDIDWRWASPPIDHWDVTVGGDVEAEATLKFLATGDYHHDKVTKIAQPVRVPVGNLPFEIDLQLAVNTVFDIRKAQIEMEANASFRGSLATGYDQDVGFFVTPEIQKAELIPPHGSVSVEKAEMRAGPGVIVSLATTSLLSKVIDVSLDAGYFRDKVVVGDFTYDIASPEPAVPTDECPSGKKADLGVGETNAWMLGAKAKVFGKTVGDGVPKWYTKDLSEIPVDNTEFCLQKSDSVLLGGAHSEDDGEFSFLGNNRRLAVGLAVAGVAVVVGIAAGIAIRMRRGKRDVNEASTLPQPLVGSA